MKKIPVFVFAMVFVFAKAGIMADEMLTPASPPDGVTIISADEAKSLLEKTDAQLFDMRKASTYGKGHLPGAVSLPYTWTKKGHPSRRTGEFDMSRLPADKNTAIVFHSNGPNGWKSYHAARAAIEAGYKNVLWMRDGYTKWLEKGYAVEK